MRPALHRCDARCRRGDQDCSQANNGNTDMLKNTFALIGLWVVIANVQKLVELAKQQMREDT